MKKLFLLTLLSGLLLSLNASAQQDKSKRPSPPALISKTISSGASISVDYSRPSLKGRTLAVLAPVGKVWRTGANEATVFETNKDVKIEGKPLPAGKYGLYTIPGDQEWTIIFNKSWKQWGTVYKESEDALRVNVKAENSSNNTETFTIEIQDNGNVSLLWANSKVVFKVR
ncbi:MAG: DUF2911 domain-containing protein [Bacteroidetes bacterium]|nr:DUF2911 domain-containing protein [Bacteroidota bacterium]